MNKIMIVKVYENDGNWHSDIEWKGNSDWFEVSDEELKFYQDNLYYANSYPYSYRIVQYVKPTEVLTIRETIEKALDKRRKEIEKQEKEAQKRKEANERNKIEQKRKQLEKLKKELGEA